MVRAFVCLFGFSLVLGCTQRSICPAYQSAYIYDKDVLRRKFSYFLEDSTPKVLTASKNKYLIAEPTPYRKKIRSLQTVAVKPVLVNVPDSLLNADSVSRADLDRAARSVIDSTFVTDVPARPAVAQEDSVYVISKDRELRLLKYNTPDSLLFDEVLGKYVAQKPSYYVKNVGLNIEQDNYMWYLRDYLVLPDVRLAQLQQKDGGQKAAGAKKKGEKKGIKGFFKNLFRKKPKEADAPPPPPPKEEFDFIDTETSDTDPLPQPDADEKKGFFSPRNKKAPAQDDPGAAVNEKKKKRAKSEEPAKTKKDEGDGF